MNEKPVDRNNAEDSDLVLRFCAAWINHIREIHPAVHSADSPMEVAALLDNERIAQAKIQRDFPVATMARILSDSTRLTQQAQMAYEAFLAQSTEMAAAMRALLADDRMANDPAVIRAEQLLRQQAQRHQAQIEE